MPARAHSNQELADEAATCNIARALSEICAPGDCLLLIGDLGAGKTAFARAFIQAQLPAAEVTSPTFNLVQTYETPRATIWHFDLYRLKSAAELPEIGLEDALHSGITLIEWPELAKDYWPEDALTVEFTMQGQGGVRLITLAGSHARWHPHLSKLNGTAS